MNLEELLTYMNAGNPLVVGTEAFDCMHALSYEAQRLTMELNSASHSPEEVRDLMSRITGRDVPEDFRLFPPFYTDFGKNIRLGRGVFINSCCCFQDQGGIEIGDGCLIGHQVVIATLNHDFDPAKRAEMTPKKVVLGKNVWVGSHATILPGVTVGDGSIIAAGAVVTKDVPERCIAAGVPARVIRTL